MAVLTQQQRNTLETSVKQARRVSETGAINALRAMAVDNPEPFPHMNPEQRSLRNRLRSKARLLGDELPSSGHQQITQLAYELAYEYWHKILFAKFLEANGLLMHPDGVSVTLDECEELAKAEGYADKWDIAASFASKMLPAIFRPEDPLMQISFAPDDRIKLEEILEELDNYIFTADDAFGWVYQFWQGEAKDAINKSGEKIDGKKLPAVTQLFTEPYMVHFLIDNTIGAWWVSRNPGVKSPIKFEYLRFLENGSPAAGKFEGWPDRTDEITAMDPCMGSGHFVVSLFTILVNLRIFEEGLSKEEATDRVIAENLHGLEIDPRCTQIAAFNLALTAWKFCGKYKQLPEMNLACSGIAPKGKKEDWIKLVGKIGREDDKIRMENGMAILYDHFQLAPELGSLLDPTLIKADLHTMSFEVLYPLLRVALDNEQDMDLAERGVMATGIAKAGLLLSQKYTLLITNVPYLGLGKQDNLITNFCLRNYPESKSDLATVFLEKMLKMNVISGASCSILPQNWMFSKSYKTFRKSLLTNKTWLFVVRLGEHAFNNADAAGAFACMLGLSKKPPKRDNIFFGLNAANTRTEKPIYASEKSNLIKSIPPIKLNQSDLLTNLDYRIIINQEKEQFLEEKLTHETQNLNIKKRTFLSHYSTILHGQSAGDNFLFNRFFWEIQEFNHMWEFYQTGPEYNAEYSGRSQIIMWENESGKMFKLADSVKHLNHKAQQWRSGKPNWGKKGIAVGLLGKIIGTIYSGNIYSQSCGVIIPNEPRLLGPIWQFVYSSEFEKNLRLVDPSLAVSIKTLLSAPFDVDYWTNEYKLHYPNGLPKPYSNDPTQWIFHGHPVKTNIPLQIAIARLLDYKWPAESNAELELSDETIELVKEIKRFDNLSDNDGIICIPSVNTEETAANRLRDYLKEVFGKEWKNDSINRLLGIENARSTNIDSWLRNEFFVQHCKVFGNRPFIWHIWDGRNDGFSVLLNYHKLTKENLSKLTYTYLGDWIRMCEAKKKAGESGAEGLLSAALKLKEKLELILEGETPYDIFVRWKPLEQQPIGWDPDLNDGVRLNIRPFIEADVLRKRPNIKWGIDRGKNPPGSPWGEIRDNDRHLTLAEKKAARGKL